ncbi:hypothetical protein MAM1_0030c02348 [Mucor ambiguus]|uniref:Uncharacterized protein n=1 Tax=Mucor ambiguus TaxID=91626 RepID=A0A0C9MLY5_9FUNG|nr:hypothetical protein MAM1_0030c02348 [Mucor ambiguus]
MGVGSFSAVADALVFLQDRDETDILKSTCAKLQFLQVDRFHFSYLNGEVVETMNVDTLQKVSGYEFAEFRTGTTNEQIISYNNNWMGKLHYKRTLLSKDLRIAVKAFNQKHGFKPKDQKSELITICVVPLVHFSSYAISPEDSKSRSELVNNNLWCQNNNKQLDFLYKKESDLLRFALKQRRHDLFHQNTSVLEVLLHYKWETAIICFGFSSDVSIFENPAHLAVIISMLISGGLLAYQELHQLLKSRTFKFYDLFDYAALILPAINLYQMLTDKPELYDVGAVTTIVLWIHGILRLRPIEFIGITLETIIKLIETVYKTIFIMLLLIIAFTHAFVVLLSHKDDSYFQEQFSGSINLTKSNLAADNAASYADDSSSNSFQDPVKAFSSLWFFLYGVWDPIKNGEAGDNYMIMFLAILFSFLTVLIFFNLVIALMSSQAEEVRTLGRGIWLSHFAAVIAEIELLWFFKSERTLSRNNPAYVFYVAKKIDVQKQIEMIEDESENLIKKMQVKCSEQKLP